MRREREINAISSCHTEHWQIYWSSSRGSPTIPLTLKSVVPPTLVPFGNAFSHTFHVEYYLFLLQLKAVFLNLVYFADEHFQVNRLLIKYWYCDNLTIWLTILHFDNLTLRHFEIFTFWQFGILTILQFHMVDNLTDFDILCFWQFENLKI